MVAVGWLVGVPVLCLGALLHLRLGTLSRACHLAKLCSACRVRPEVSGGCGGCRGGSAREKWFEAALGGKWGQRYGQKREGEALLRSACALGVCGGCGGSAHGLEIDNGVWGAVSASAGGMFSA